MSNKRLDRVFSIILIILFIFTVGCSNKAQNEAVDSKVEEIEKEAGSSEEQESIQVIKIIDMSGREIEVPKKINKVYGVNNNSTFLLYTIVPDRMIGWNFQLSEDTKKYIPDKYSQYPVVGNIYGNSKLADAEEVIKYSPDVIVLADSKISKKTKEKADDIQVKMGLPVIVVEANITNYDKAYEFLGEVFDENEKAKELGNYYKEAYEYAKEKSALIDNKIKVYYAREDDGLSTDFKGSSHTEILDLVGGENVAILNSDSKGKEKGNGNGSAQSGTVSIEQILLWNPELIIVGYNGSERTAALETIKSGPMWAKTDAVKNGEVYEIPHEPFNWFDRPPSVNRIIGIKWLGNLLYPEVYDFDVKEEVKKFFKLYYRYDLSDEELEELINTPK